jgi:hypothetical protein
MPRRRKEDKQPASKGNGQASTEDSVAGYFRQVFAENPAWLKGRSNQAVLERWLADHPGEKEVPDRVKQNLANIKSVLRKKLRKGGRPKKQAEAAPETASQPAARVYEEMEALEVLIDDALTLARTLDREGLESVIGHLRRARNEVVWRTGEPA